MPTPATRKQVLFYVESEDEKAKLLRDARRLGLTLTEFLNRGLKIGLPVVKKTMRKAQRDQNSITQKTKVDLKEE